MPFDFPSAPSNGQQVTAPNGAVFTWNGTTWAPVSVGLPAYAPLASPVFTGDARAVTPAYADNDTSIATTAFVQSAVAPVANNTGRNLIHNATFVVQQRGAGSWTANGYTADRWTFYINVSAASVNVNPLNDANRASIGDENARYSLNTTFTGTAGAADAVFCYQPIEGVRRLSGKTVTLSFWASTGSGSLKLGASIDLIPGSGGSPSANVLGNGQTVTINPAWTRYSLTFSVPSSAGLTLGTNGNDSTNLNLWLTTGANFNTRSGNVGVQSGTINIYGVQLEVGSVATSFDAGGTPADQLRQCQRFYQVIDFVTLVCLVTGTSYAGSLDNISFPVRMRATPTMVATHVGGNVSVGASTAATPIGFNTWLAGAPAAGNFESFSFTASADL